MEVYDDLEAIQKELAPQIKIPKEPLGTPQAGQNIMALDVQYHGDLAYVAATMQTWPEPEIKTWVGYSLVKLSYQAGLFCFREGPILYNFIQHLAQKAYPFPDWIVVDGHGIAHPRRFGVASFVGLALNLPTIGCAKRSLLSFSGSPDKKQGSTLDILLKKETVGYALRTQEDVKPIFVSPGHLIDLESSKDTILSLGGEFRIPDLLRLADQAARVYAQEEDQPDWIDLGEVPVQHYAFNLDEKLYL